LDTNHYEGEVLKSKIKECNVMVVRSKTKIKKDIIAASLESNKLKLIVRGGVGVDNIDVQYARIYGVKVCNTSKASSWAVAELAIGHMFAVAR
jgi:D-3-phosphoglycerate dehydrogenase